MAKLFSFTLMSPLMVYPFLVLRTVQATFAPFELSDTWLPTCVEVVERTPVAVVNVGGVYQADEDGVLFDLPSGSYVRLPVVSGLRDTLGAGGLRRLTGSSLVLLRSTLKALQKSDTGWVHHLSQIDMSSPGRLLMTIDGYPARIAVRADDITRRMNQLRRLLEVLAEENAGRVRAIDMSTGTVAYVRRDAAGGAVHQNQK